MISSRKAKYKPRRREWVLCYAMFSVLLVLGLFTVFIVWRQALLFGMLALEWDPFTIRPLYLFSMVGLGILLFIAVGISEIYLREGLACRQLRVRFFRLAVPLAVLLIAGELLRRWAITASV
ncbi:MAG: hypothetical protein M3P51_05655 [Chloroflexota bacterium]|nr:hypothetical protein [Chloroflexota bacterium]